MTLTITPFGGGASETYSHTYGGETGGSGIGLGAYGTARADNFGANLPGAVPEPASLTLLFGGVAAFAMLRLRNRRSSAR